MPRKLRVEYAGAIYHGISRGYLKTACDYVHLNPVRAKLLGIQERPLAYPWSSWVWYLTAPEHRPKWMRMDRLLGEHRLREDTVEARAELERRMEWITGRLSMGTWKSASVQVYHWQQAQANEPDGLNVAIL